MGVKGLWKVIESVGVPVPLETLEHKVLAVDVSIWLHQAVRGFRGPGGAAVANAHLLTLFHRICKLLFYRIRPVFVFDGGVPYLKKQTLASRKLRREVAENKARQVRERLLKNLLKSQAVRNALGKSGPGPSSVHVPRIVKKEKDLFELPPLPETVKEETNIGNSDEDHSSIMHNLSLSNLHQFDFESEEFKSLSLEMKHEILSELQDTRKQNSWATINDMPQQSESFAEFQMARLMKRAKFQSTLDSTRGEIQKIKLSEMESELFGDLEKYVSLSRRIISEDATHAIFVKKVEETTGGNTENRDIKCDKFDDTSIKNKERKGKARVKKKGLDKDFLTELAREGVILPGSQHSDSDSDDVNDSYFNLQHYYQEQACEEDQKLSKVEEDENFLQVVGSLMENSGLTQDEILALIKQDHGQNTPSEGDNQLQHGPCTSANAPGFIYNSDADSSDEDDFVEVPSISESPHLEEKKKECSENNIDNLLGTKTNSLWMKIVQQKLDDIVHVSTLKTSPKKAIFDSRKSEKNEDMKNSKDVSKTLKPVKISLDFEVKPLKMEDNIFSDIFTDLICQPESRTKSFIGDVQRIHLPRQSIAAQRKRQNLENKMRKSSNYSNSEVKTNNFPVVEETSGKLCSESPIREKGSTTITSHAGTESDTNNQTKVTSTPGEEGIEGEEWSVNNNEVEIMSSSDESSDEEKNMAISTQPVPPQTATESEILEISNGNDDEGIPINTQPVPPQAGKSENLKPSHENDKDLAASIQPVSPQTTISEKFKPRNDVVGKGVRTQSVLPQTAKADNNLKTSNKNNKAFRTQEVPPLIISDNSDPSETQLVSSENIISEDKNTNNIFSMPHKSIIARQEHTNLKHLMSSKDIIYDDKDTKNTYTASTLLVNQASSTTHLDSINTCVSGNEYTKRRKQYISDGDIDESMEMGENDSRSIKDMSDEESRQTKEHEVTSLTHSKSNSEAKRYRKGIENIVNSHSEIMSLASETGPRSVHGDLSDSNGGVEGSNKEENKDKVTNNISETYKDMITQEAHSIGVEDKSRGNKAADKVKIKDTVEVEKPLEYTEDELKHLEGELASEQQALVAQAQKSERIAASLNDQMYGEAQYLLQLFGIPFLVAPMEAEAQCGFLNIANLTEGTITDDSDIFLFGGNSVYRNFFNQTKHVEHFKLDNIKVNIGLDRHKMISLALITGSDYTEGLEGVGSVGAMEILTEFPGEGIQCLHSVRKWWSAAHSSVSAMHSSKIRQKLVQISLPESFPNEKVYEAYLTPEVDESREKFTWAVPNVEALRVFVGERFGWNHAKADEILLPVMKKLKLSTSQKRIDSYFTNIKLVKDNKITSKRMQDAIAKAKGEMPSDTGSPKKSNKSNTVSMRKASQKKKGLRKNESELEKKESQQSGSEDNRKSQKTPRKTLLIDPSESSSHSVSSAGRGQKRKSSDSEGKTNLSASREGEAPQQKRKITKEDMFMKLLEKESISQREEEKLKMQERKKIAAHILQNQSKPKTRKR